jgi:hypothetical protein
MPQEISFILFVVFGNEGMMRSDKTVKIKSIMLSLHLIAFLLFKSLFSYYFPKTWSLLAELESLTALTSFLIIIPHWRMDFQLLAPSSIIPLRACVF